MLKYQKIAYIPVEQAFRELIKAAQAGDQQAFDQLYNQYTGALYRYLYHKCNNQTVAEDILADFWLRIVERIDRFKPPSENIEQAFSAWLYTIARNLITDYYRRNKRHQATELPETLESEHNVAHEVAQRAEQHEVRDALGALTNDQRDVVILRFFEGYTSAEVAELTGRTEYAVKSLQHRALGALKRVLRTFSHDET